MSNGHGLEWAKKFHDLYEKLAPGFGYETRPDTKEFDPLSRNGQLMQQVCGEIVEDARLSALRELKEWAKSESAQASLEHGCSMRSLLAKIEEMEGR